MKQKACYFKFLNFMQDMLERNSVTYASAQFNED